VVIIVSIAARRQLGQVHSFLKAGIDLTSKKIQKRLRERDSTCVTAQRLPLSTTMDLRHQRKEYEYGSIDVSTVDPNPFVQFAAWFKEATDSGMLEPNAMIVSTVDPERRPTQRTVLLKYFDESGFVFFTNYNSRKATQIAGNPNLSVLFPWYTLQRQVEISGLAEKVSTAESMKYFALRPRGSQLGAWVSQQSTVVSTRSLLQNKLANLTAKFASGKIPMPEFWGGYRIVPHRLEFWQGGVNRLHDRIEYRLKDDDKDWHRQRLSP
jgi:pyridoxamine 5'-phosphate oxidase